MSVRNFVPTVWAQEMLFHLDKSHIWAQPSITNRTYEGQISGLGDRVKINQIGDVEIGEYEPNSDISSAQSLTSEQIELVIDRARYFNFQVDDVDRVQANADLVQAGSARAAYGLQDDRDKFLAELYATSVPSGSAHNLGSAGSPVAITRPAQAYNLLVRLATLLDRKSVTDSGRWFIAEPEFVNLLALDSRFTRGTGDAEDVRRNGFSGRAANFDIYKSNNAHSSNGTQNGVAGIPAATSYAEQIPIDSMEAYRPERRFADAIKGLHLSGAKVIKPEAMGRLRYTVDADLDDGGGAQAVHLVSTSTTVPVEVTGQPIDVNDVGGGGD